MKPILVIDNYDSFTFNLVQELGCLGAQLEVLRNDKLTVAEACAKEVSGILIGPGPCAPDSAGISLELILAAAGHIPILGVCLGHQAIGAAYGGAVVRNTRIVHGKASAVRHHRAGIFRIAPSPLQGGRYHSLIIAREKLPQCLQVTAWTDDGEIMGIRHRTLDVEGVQFHPESVLTPDGRILLGEWLRRISSPKSKAKLVSPEAKKKRSKAGVRS
jgi:anthranilate synthase/aminodeoxychorismate synthase-like glutamine amidotransferase